MFLDPWIVNFPAEWIFCDLMNKNSIGVIEALYVSYELRPWESSDDESDFLKATLSLKAAILAISHKSYKDFLADDI